nr:glutathione S transferase [Hymenolepis microstoma]
MAPILSYWDIRGLTEQIRLLLRPDNLLKEWLDEKFKLGLDLPNLPYYIDGEFKLTQSAAILEYIADTHNMIPSCKKQRAVLHMLFNAALDLRLNFARICYSPDFINYPDFSLCELLNQLEKFEPSCLSEFPKLKAYLTRFENLPELKEYMSSEVFKKRNCMGIMAKWRNNN